MQPHEQEAVFRALGEACGVPGAFAGESSWRHMWAQVLSPYTPDEIARATTLALAARGTGQAASTPVPGLPRLPDLLESCAAVRFAGPPRPPLIADPLRDARAALLPDQGDT